MVTSIVILTYNKLEFTMACIESIRMYTEEGSYELIVVDNHSTDGTIEWLKKQKDIKYILNETNQGFPKGCNQGVGISSGDNILLLNNDTIVTSNWLDQLHFCLYSSEDIGAVGPVTNYCSYGQTISTNYSTIEEMQKFAYDFNLSDPSRWEERLKLIGFCMLIKKEVIDEIGLLDERFTPGNFEDDDYSLRIRKAGYRLILCKDTFIHHYGSVSWKDNVGEFNNLLSVNEKKFQEKWGFNPNDASINFALIARMQLPLNQELNVLEIGCGAGATLLKIKQLAKRVNLFGIEENVHAASVAMSFANVLISGLDDTDWTFTPGSFDYIILSNSLELCKNPIDFLNKISKYLKPDGTLYATVKNLNYFVVIRRILNEQPLVSSGNTRFYSLAEIENVFANTPFQSVKYFNEVGAITQDDQKFIRKLAEMASSKISSHYEISQYLVEARFGGAYNLDSIIRDLDENFLKNVDLEVLNSFEIEEIIQAVLSHSLDRIGLLNRLATLYFKKGKFDCVIPFLSKAFEIDPHHTDTLFNLSQVFYAIGEYRQALQYLFPLIGKDPEAKKLYERINSKLKTDDELYHQWVYAVRRIEIDRDSEQSLKKITEWLGQGDLQIETLVEILEKESLGKADLLNKFGTLFYQSGLYNYVLPCLKKAVELDRTNDDILYNLGFFLYRLQQYEMALFYLESISNQDAEVRELIMQLKGGVQHG